MPDLLSLLRTYSGVLSDSECDAVLREHAALEHAGQASYESSLHAITGKQTQSTFKAVSLSPGTAAFDIVHRCTQQVIQRWVRELQAERKFNITAFRQCLRYSHDYRVLRYDVGAQIHPHTDWDVFTFASCTLALNDGYTGGEFSFFNGEHTVRLKKGQALIWPADCFWVHEVTPVASGTRYSVNSFITSIPEAMKLQTVEQLNGLPKSRWASPYRHHITE